MTARRPGDLAFVYEASLAPCLGSPAVQIAPAFEIEGLGRAPAAFVANCDPYTYAGRFRSTSRRARASSSGSTSSRRSS